MSELSWRGIAMCIAESLELVHVGFVRSLASEQLLGRRTPAAGGLGAGWVQVLGRRSSHPGARRGPSSSGFYVQTGSQITDWRGERERNKNGQNDMEGDSL